jgi:hypothetical protein
MIMGKDKHSDQRKNRSSSKKQGRDDSNYEDRRLDYPGKRKGKRINPDDWDRIEDDGWRT